MKVVEVRRAGGPLTVAERPLPQPQAHQVRIRVEACGICHGDLMAVHGYHPGITFPRVPGHEVIGRIDAVGPEAEGWTVGQRVGVGYVHGPLGVTGVTVDGGYAEYMVAHENALVAIDEAWDAVVAAPLMCAGVTTFSALRQSAARPGDIVAIVGMGGLGHLAVQYARHFGYYTVALTRSPEKVEGARQLGAHEAILIGAADPAAELLRLGGAKLILVTAPNAELASQLVRGLAHDGQLLTVIGGGEPLVVSPGEILGRRLSIRGWRVDDPEELPRALAFSLRAGVRPEVEAYPLDEAAYAFQRMLDGTVHYRAVLVPGRSQG
ncbi:MAG: alcohol dehydrogenase catalytic domain-containing protein [Firmicutes bacterium]|nr:alcohol dehydrogenase catalytic domain-containing protein [Bacillota bacterium]